MFMLFCNFYRFIRKGYQNIRTDGQGHTYTHRKSDLCTHDQSTRDTALRRALRLQQQRTCGDTRSSSRWWGWSTRWTGPQPPRTQSPGRHWASIAMSSINQLIDHFKMSNLHTRFIHNHNGGLYSLPVFVSEGSFITKTTLSTHVWKFSIADSLTTNNLRFERDRERVGWRARLKNEPLSCLENL